ncbi:sensor domain-containing diguanylate cyclase [Halomonas tibetensis]|uniref:diguanylate cyclase n=1 Tax=Halomonas tibetensis TaxID=2259590 RepID=A0ABV7B8H4_9GAMM
MMRDDPRFVADESVADESVADGWTPLLEAMLSMIGAGMWEWRLSDGHITGDDRLKAMLALPDDEWETLTIASWARRIHPEDRALFEQEWQRAQHSGAFEATYRMHCGDSQWRWLHDRSCTLDKDPDGTPSRLLGIVEDVTERQEEQRRWRHLAKSVPGIIYTFVLDAEGRPSFPYTSSRVKEFYGATPEQVREDADLVFNAIHPDDRLSVQESIHRSAATLEDWHCEYRARAAGSWHWVEGRATPEREPDGSTVWHGLIYLIDERKAMEERLRRLSLTDELTGLYNRRHLLARMEEEIARYARHGTPFSVVMIDLDHFKLVNDSHGHAAGDAVLQGLAALFKERLRDSDVAGRSGGEEFLLLLPGTDEAGARAIAETLRKAFSQMRFDDGKASTFTVTLSAGVAEMRHRKERLQHLWARADGALYLAKAQGRNQVC